MMQGIFADQAQYIQELLDFNFLSYMIYLWFLILGNLGALNLFIGVCVDVVNKVSDVEEKYRRDELATDATVKMLHEVDSDNSHLISIWEFRDLWELGGFIFFDKDEISIDELQKQILQLRGSNPVTVKDVVDTRKFFLEELDRRI